MRFLGFSLLLHLSVFIGVHLWFSTAIFRIINQNDNTADLYNSLSINTITPKIEGGSRLTQRAETPIFRTSCLFALPSVIFLFSWQVLSRRLRGWVRILFFTIRVYLRNPRSISICGSAALVFSGLNSSAAPQERRWTVQSRGPFLIPEVKKFAETGK
jgi:hypothetical protein